MGFLAKLWRGEVSLGTTFWVFGVLVVFMFQIFELVPMANPAAAKTLVFFSSAYYLFISIAVFRSSFRHRGSRLFNIYTQLSAAGLILWVLFRIFFSALGSVEGIS